MAKKPLSSTERTDADRRVRQADRTATILRILELIQGNGRWNVKDLAREFECSERTIHRYLDVLKYAGVPYWFDADKQCYRVRPGFRFPSLNLTSDEVLAQAVSTAVWSTPGLGEAVGESTTTDKIAAVADDETQEILREVRRVVSVLDLKFADHSRHKEILRTLQWSLLHGKQDAAEYESPYQESPVRFSLHPIRLCFVRQAWYLIARSATDKPPKTYRVPRFKSAKALPADADVPDQFDLHEYFGNAWGVMRGETNFDVKLRFLKDSAKLVTETTWHHTQKTTSDDNGDLILTFNIDGLSEIVWWLLGWAGFVEVLEPVELREMMVEQLNRGIELNQK